MAGHPGLTLLADDRELLAALVYYVPATSFECHRMEPDPRITDHCGSATISAITAVRISSP